MIESDPIHHEVDAALRENAELYRLLTGYANEFIHTACGQDVTARDDGVGFDGERTREQAAQRDRLGLLGMRERVEILGGSLQIHSEPGHGTRFRVSLPVARAATEAGEDVA